MTHEPFIEVEQYEIYRLLLAVYKTDEENWEQYIPLTGSDKKTDTEETSENTANDDDEGDNFTKGFTLHQGKIIETYYYGEFTHVEWESDYEDINASASLNIPEIKDLNRFYKGVRLSLYSASERLNEHVTFNGILPKLTGFITDETFNESGMSLKISGMSKLLEQKYEFNFTQMKISEILKEMIKTAGLEPVVDATGLDDQVIDYSNVSSDGESGSVDNGNLPADACKFAKQLTKGKKGQRAKAESIYNWINSNFPYKRYDNSHYNEQNIYSTAKANMGKRIFNCCDHAHLSVVLLRCAGLKANYIHVTGHVYTVVYIEGQRVMFDPLGYGRGMGTVASGFAKDGAESESINF